MFFNWVHRTFAPRHYATMLAIRASNTVSNVVLDSRGGSKNREAISKVVKFNNTLKGSKYIKNRK